MGEDVTYRGQLSGLITRELDQRSPQSHADPKDIPWAASHFVPASLMTWSVPEGGLYSFWVIERSPVEMMVNVVIAESTIGGTVNGILQLRLPFGKVASRQCDAVGYLYNGGASSTCVIVAFAGSPLLSIARTDLASFTAGDLAVGFQMTVRTVAPR